jgi:hypothetical protein
VLIRRERGMKRERMEKGRERRRERRREEKGREMGREREREKERRGMLTSVARPCRLSS